MPKGNGSLFVYCTPLIYGPDVLHPADRAAYRAIRDSGYEVFESASTEAGYERLRAPNLSFRVRQGSVRPLKHGPRFMIGDTVRTLPPRSPRTARIRRIQPHFRRGVPIYLLDITGRRKRSYFEESQLEAVPPATVTER